MGSSDDLINRSRITTTAVRVGSTPSPAVVVTGHRTRPTPGYDLPSRCTAAAVGAQSVDVAHLLLPAPPSESMGISLESDAVVEKLKAAFPDLGLRSRIC